MCHSDWARPLELESRNCWSLCPRAGAGNRRSPHSMKSSPGQSNKDPAQPKISEWIKKKKKKAWQLLLWFLGTSFWESQLLPVKDSLPGRKFRRPRAEAASRKKRCLTPADPASQPRHQMWELRHHLTSAPPPSYLQPHETPAEASRPSERWEGKPRGLFPASNWWDSYYPARGHSNTSPTPLISDVDEQQHKISTQESTEICVQRWGSALKHCL